MGKEPVAIISAINAALAATWGVLIIALDIEPELAGAVTVALGAWVGVAGAIVRQRVTPVTRDE